MTNECLKPIGLHSVRINDGFWRRYMDLITDVAIPYQWDILNDRIEGRPSYCLRNFRIAAGEESGRHSGIVFIDSDVMKWLETVAYSLTGRPDDELAKNADDVIDLIGRAQQSDGYLNTYYTIARPDKRWGCLTEGHELYCAGHMIEAAAAYFQSTGKRPFLDIAVRFADLICEVFGTGENQNHGYPGHQEIELALVKLYRATNNRRYLEQAKYFIDVRGHQPNYFIEEIEKTNGEDIFNPELKVYDPAYSQSHMPPREQKTAEGHAVRALYMYSAMADIAEAYDDAELLAACETLWENIVERRMYITGSVGSSARMERFTTDFDLPNDVNYSETCASVGLMMFGARMARIKKDASYFDAVEKALYNTVLAGISLSGDRYFYVNPLEVWPASCMAHTSKMHVKTVRQEWFDCACCPTNVARTLTALGDYVASYSKDALYLNLFISHSAKVTLGDTAVEVELDSSFMKDGSSKLCVRPEKPAEFAINIRIPQYVKGYSIKVDGADAGPVHVENGYARLSGMWSKESCIDIWFDIQAELVAAHPEVRADAGKIAIVKGPLVYCLEEADNGGNLASVFVRQDAQLEECFDQNLFGGTATIKCKGEKIIGWGNGLYKPAPIKTRPVELTAIPYFLWGNRGENEMIVWLKAIL